MHHTARGFTLIEVMMVIAIIAMLIALALPAYKDFMLRGRVAEAFALAGAHKAAVTVSATEGAPDLSANASLLAPGTQNVTSSTVNGANGAITVTTTVRAGGGTITLTPSDGAGLPLQAGTIPTGSIDWTCTATLPQKYMPSTCLGS